MKDLLEGPRGFLLGFAAALISTIIVLGSFFLALTEGGTRIALLPTSPATSTFTPSASPTQANSPTPLPTVPPGAPTFTPSPTPSATPTPSQTPTTPPIAANCPPQEGWITISLELPETLQNVAQQYGLSTEELAAANCMNVVVTSQLPVGTILNVPLWTASTPTPTSTSKATATPKFTEVSCGPPRGWTTYRVKPGDNLFRIGLKYRVSVAMLQFANCLGSSTTIRTGQLLYVPNVPTSTFVSTATPTNTPTTPVTPSSTPTATATTQPPTAVPTTAQPPTSTATFTSTPMPTSTFTATPIPTDTFTPTSTFTLPPSDTPESPTPPLPSPVPIFTNTLPPAPTDTSLAMETSIATSH